MANYTIDLGNDAHSDDLQAAGSTTTLEFIADNDTFVITRRDTSGARFQSAAFARTDVVGLNTAQLKTAVDLILAHAISLAGGTPV